ncbi:hypothetical protein BCV69DRAFT_71663 [Microstroma glucosiphilum]|uniref:Uncharacterized protein n=1 Tax=Pseudomicrostroma glucosiphilum TaxID=1684307 RepID=A0A316TYM6_9BASI|nr:hypothetical protein BCV69DRAFT_71663 [Pseudomicrostroma glucosiphilum]PWN18389.1 hypothetical protein BCV69DRAFT_71663 [Pseudomicrostroma glucosiphilum]
MRSFPISPRSPGLPLRSNCAPATRGMIATSNRRQRPTSLNLSAAHSKRVSRSFDKFSLPADLPRAAMPAIKPNAGKKWVDGQLKVKDFGLEGERPVMRASSMPFEEPPACSRPTPERPRSLDPGRLSTSSATSVGSDRQAAGKVQPPVRLSARQPSIDEVSSMRPGFEVTNVNKSLDSSIRKAIHAPRLSMDLIWTSKTTAEPPEESPMAPDLACHSFEEGASVRLLMNTELDEPEARTVESGLAKTEPESTKSLPASDRDTGPMSDEDVEIASPSASSEGSVYSRPSALPALQSGLWGPSRTSRTSKGGLLSALPTGVGGNLRSARPVVTLTPFLEGTPVMSANTPASLGACEIGSGGTMSSNVASSAALSEPCRSTEDTMVEDGATDASKSLKQPLVGHRGTLEQQRPSVCENALPPRPPEPVMFHPCSHYSLRTLARSNLPEKVPIPYSVPNDTSDKGVSQAIEIDAGQPWAWSCSHPVSASTSAESQSTVKRPNTFEPPPTYSRRRASIFDADHSQAQPGTRTLLAVQQSCPDPKTLVAGLLGPRGRRLSIVLPPAATISKKTLAVQVVGN